MPNEIKAASDFPEKPSGEAFLAEVFLPEAAEMSSQRFIHYELASGAGWEALREKVTDESVEVVDRTEAEIASALRGAVCAKMREVDMLSGFQVVVSKSKPDGKVWRDGDDKLFAHVLLAVPRDPFDCYRVPFYGYKKVVNEETIDSYRELAFYVDLAA